MVYGRYNELVFMGFINQLITEGHHPVDTHLATEHRQIWVTLPVLMRFYHAKKTFSEYPLVN